MLLKKHPYEHFRAKRVLAMFYYSIAKQKGDVKGLCQKPLQIEAAKMALRAPVLLVKQIDALISGRGRVLLRESGTEPVIRVMIECESTEKCEQYADTIAKAVFAGGHGLE